MCIETRIEQNHPNGAPRLTTHIAATAAQEAASVSSKVKNSTKRLAEYPLAKRRASRCDMVDDHVYDLLNKLTRIRKSYYAFFCSEGEDYYGLPAQDAEERRNALEELSSKTRLAIVQDWVSQKWPGKDIDAFMADADALKVVIYAQISVFLYNVGYAYSDDYLISLYGYCHAHRTSSRAHALLHIEEHLITIMNRYLPSMTTLCAGLLEGIAEQFEVSLGPIRTESVAAAILKQHDRLAAFRRASPKIRGLDWFVRNILKRAVLSPQEKLAGQIFKAVKVQTEKVLKTVEQVEQLSYLLNILKDVAQCEQLI